MKNKAFIVFLLFSGCSDIKDIPQKTGNYTVVSSFNEVVHETRDKEEALETAHYLTLMGRVLASKPVYFVLEK